MVATVIGVCNAPVHGIPQLAAKVVHAQCDAHAPLVARASRASRADEARGLPAASPFREFERPPAAAQSQSKNSRGEATEPNPDLDFYEVFVS